MSERTNEELALELQGAARTSDGRTRIEIGAGAPLRLGSDAARATAVVAGLAPLHATVAPIKGGGVGLRVESGAPAQLNGAAVSAARLAVGDVIALGTQDGGTLELRVVDLSKKVRAPLPKVPGYRLERQLGRGAMGRVYLAVQESLDRKVALKLLEPELCKDAAFVAEFQSEARAAAALHHTNVVTVFDVGEFEGRHFLALEYMDRGSLEDRLVKEGALPWRAVLGILRDAAAGLEYAESKGIVHRDIKPANLMQNATGVTKIVDLGLAIAAESEAGGRIRGTAHFMAPEQARGEAVDPRADLYALGASAWRLLTARTPFTGNSPKEILRAALTEPAPPLAPLVPGLPSDVEKLVLDLLAKQKEQRPANARAVRERIEALVQKHVAGGAASGDDGAPKKSRVPLFVGLAVVVIGGVATFVAMSGGDPAEPVVPPIDTGAQPIDVVQVPPTITDTSDGSNGDASTGTNTDSAHVGEEDAALRLVEEEAQRVLASADGLTDPELVRLRLLEVVERFAGTTAATLASERLEAAAPAVVEQAAVVDVDGLRNRELAAREKAARDANGQWLAPQFALLALESAAVPTALANDEASTAAFAALVARAETELRATARTRLDAANALVDAGRFEEARASLDATLAWLTDAPPPPTPANPSEPAPPPRPLRLGELVDETLAARAALPELAERYERAMAHVDHLERHREIFGESPLAGDLARLDLASAAARVDALAVKSADGAQWVQSHTDWLADGGRFAALLRSTFGAGEWRRKSVAVPSAKREVREVVSIDDRGLVFGSGSDFLPLSAFGGSTDLVNTLVFERLARGWNEDERRTIACVMVATALQELLALTRPALDGAKVDPAAASTANAALERVRAWVAPSDEDLEAELAAARVCAALLEALANGDVGRSAWAADALVFEHGRTLLVTCLSNGGSLEAPPAWPIQR
jgi:tetratricopeptide (TPR) repeat protein